MIDALPKNQTFKQMNQAYYGQLVPQNLLIEILNQFENDQERDQAFKTIVAILDRNAIHAVMAYLQDHEAKIAFLELLRDEYNSAHPLEWATLQFDNAEQVIQESIERTLLAILSALKEHK